MAIIKKPAHRLNLKDMEPYGLLAWIEILAREQGIEPAAKARQLLQTHPEVQTRFREEIEKWKR